MRPIICVTSDALSTFFRRSRPVAYPEPQRRYLEEVRGGPLNKRSGVLYAEKPANLCSYKSTRCPRSFANPWTVETRGDALFEASGGGSSGAGH